MLRPKLVNPFIVRYLKDFENYETIKKEKFNIIDYSNTHSSLSMTKYKYIEISSVDKYNDFKENNLLKNHKIIINTFNDKLKPLYEHASAIIMQITGYNTNEIINISNLTVDVYLYGAKMSTMLKYLNYLPSSTIVVKSTINNLNNNTMRNLPNKIQVINLNMYSIPNIRRNRKIKFPRNIYLLINRGKVRHHIEDKVFRDYVFKTNTLDTLFHYERSGKKIYNKN